MRRAREQVLMQAGGTRVPVEVIPSLSASELEVGISAKFLFGGGCGARSDMDDILVGQSFGCSLGRLIHIWRSRFVDGPLRIWYLLVL